MKIRLVWAEFYADRQADRQRRMGGRTDGRTVMTNLIVAFCNVTVWPKHRDFRLPSQCNWGLHTSGMLRDVGWLRTFRDKLSLPSSKVLDCLALEDWTNRLSLNVRNQPTSRNIPEVGRPLDKNLWNWELRLAIPSTDQTSDIQKRKLLTALSNTGQHVLKVCQSLAYWLYIGHI
jgi:hypothetical protein